MKTKYNIGDVFHTLDENNEVVLNIIYSVDVERKNDKNIVVVYKTFPVKQKKILNETSYSYKLQKLISEILSFFPKPQNNENRNQI